MSHEFVNLGWNGFGSNFMGWVGIGAENLPHEDLYCEGHFLVICTAKHINPRRHRGEVDTTPLGFSENNSRTDRPIVAKLRIGTYPLNYFTSF